MVGEIQGRTKREADGQGRDGRQSVTVTIIILSVVILALFPLGYILGSRSANDAIKHERSMVVNLQAQNDGLQTRMLTMLDETIRGGAK